MKRLLYLLPLLSSLAFGQGLVAHGPAAIHGPIAISPGTAAAGISVTGYGPTLQNNNPGTHTCTVSNVVATTGDSVMATSVTETLSGSISATYNGISMTQYGSGVGYPGNLGEEHSFTLNNVTGTTANIVMTKTNSGDDGVAFDCVGIVIHNLTSHALDQTQQASSAASTTYSAGTTGTTTAANEAVVAVLGAHQQTISFGTWSNSFIRISDGSNSSVNCCGIDFAYLIVSSTGTYTGTTTGNTSAANGGQILTFK